ncbi:MAG: hypothetical protein ACKOB6_02965, partial [Candidatus Kapaibacterium sp.]
MHQPDASSDGTYHRHGTASPAQSWSRCLLLSLSLLLAHSPSVMASVLRADSMAVRSATTDSVTAIVARPSGGIDTVVTYKAKDSVVFSLKSKKMRLRGSATTALRSRVLESEVIEISFDSGLMTGTGVKDTTGRLEGTPILHDNGSSYAGEVIRYNFKDQLGTVTLGETTIDNGFFTGSKIKRNADRSLFVERGCFTTCDRPHPHFY